jgi:peptidoglycan lytic transglycosylase
VVRLSVWYYRHVRRVVIFIGLLATFSACGRKAKVAVPQNNPVAVADSPSEGLASYYAEPYDGRKTASGEIFDSYHALTAAHRTLPFNTMVRVTNKTNGESVDVRINDRGPFVNGRVIDLSLFAAQKIDMVRAGVAPVKLEILKQNELAQNKAMDGGYAVQVGAFSSRESAEDLKKRLDRKFEGVTIQVFNGDTTIYRVRVGPQPDLESAQKLASQLRKEDLRPFVVRED